MDFGSLQCSLVDLVLERSSSVRSTLVAAAITARGPGGEVGTDLSWPGQGVELSPSTLAMTARA